MSIEHIEDGVPDPVTRVISKKWRAQNTIMDTVSLDDTVEKITSSVDLETGGYYASHVVVIIEFGATPEYNAVVSLYGSLDGSNFDTTPMFSQEIDKTTDPNQISLIIQDVAHFRIGIKQSGVVTNDAVATVKEQSYRMQST